MSGRNLPPVQSAFSGKLNITSRDEHEEDGEEWVAPEPCGVADLQRAARAAMRKWLNLNSTSHELHVKQHRWA